MTVQVRRELDELRARLEGGELDRAGLERALEGLPERLEGALRERAGAALRRVLNATGILLHTNLGRAPLPGAIAGDARSARSPARISRSVFTCALVMRRMVAPLGNVG